MEDKKASISFKEFAKSHRLLLAILILLPIVGVLIYCIAFRNDLLNAGAWGSIIAGLFTYFGTITLGVFTFYHAWQQEKIQADLQEIKVEIGLYALNENGFFVPYSEEELNECEALPLKAERFEESTDQGQDICAWNFIGFKVKNINHLVNFDIKFIDIFFVNKNHELQRISDRIKMWASGSPGPIDYKEVYSCYIGCDAKILSKKYMETQKYFNWFIVFSITDTNLKEKYVICDYVLGETFKIKKTIISKEEYQKRKKAHGSPIILTKYNQQFFN